VGEGGGGGGGGGEGGDGGGGGRKINEVILSPRPLHHPAPTRLKKIPKKIAHTKVNFPTFFFHYTAKTKYRNFETNISRKGLSGSQSQFPHSCDCERFIYSHDRSPCSAGEICTPILGLYKSLTDT
jgi:hypothetical protein